MYLNRIGSIRKRIKIPIFSLKKSFFVTQTRFSRFLDLLCELKVTVYRSAGNKK